MIRYPETANALLYPGRFPNLTLWTIRVTKQLHSRAYPFCLMVSLLTSWSLQLRLINRFPLREDEAIYSYWAIHGWRADPFFLSVWPDKPPLFLWLLGGAFQLWGASPAAGRLLNIAITTLTILMAAAIARRLWGKLAGVAAAVAASLNPFTISFAATVYTDPLLVFAGCTAVYMALTRRAFWAGVWLGIAIMTKQQGLLYLPLIVALLFVPYRNTPPIQKRDSPYHLVLLSSCHLVFFVGLALVCGPMIYWDSLRWAVAPSPWDLSMRNYGVLTFTAPTQWLERLYAWGNLAWHLTASWPVWILTMLLTVDAVCNRTGIYAVTNRTYAPPIQSPTNAARQHYNHLVTLSPCHLVILWGVAFFALHVVTSVQIWDRYLLPLAPLTALGIGWLTAQIYARLTDANIERRWLSGASMIALLLLLPPALTAAGGGLPIGGDHGAYAGLDEAVAWVQHTASGQALLYHRRLGWHDRFYFYDAIATGRYELRWFPHALKLAQDAAATPYRRRFLLEPIWAPVRDLAQQLARHRLQLVQERRFGQLLVYEIANRPAFPCSWCVCIRRLPKGWSILPQLSPTGWRP